MNEIFYMVLRNYDNDNVWHPEILFKDISHAIKYIQDSTEYYDESLDNSCKPFKSYCFHDYAWTHGYDEWERVRGKKPYYFENCLHYESSSKDENVKMTIKELQFLPGVAQLEKEKHHDL